MGSYRRDRHTVSRNSAGSTTERAPAAALRRFERPCQIRHQDAVKIPGRERYITDSKTAAKPSSGFTIHGCQAFQPSVLGEVLQTNQIELQNNLHSPLSKVRKSALSCRNSVCGEGMIVVADSSPLRYLIVLG